MAARDAAAAKFGHIWYDYVSYALLVTGELGLRPSTPL